jgi:hypothetical protein
MERPYQNLEEAAEEADHLAKSRDYWLGLLIAIEY